MEYFIADLHFNHKRILELTRPQFRHLDEMHNKIIKEWNKVVTNNDIVWILGDLGFGNPDTILQHFIRSLNGHKRLVLGNHDTYNPDRYLAIGFEQATRNPVIYQQRYILSHEPMTVETGDLKNIYGHVHSSPQFPDATKKSACVSWERYEKPVSLSFLVQQMEIAPTAESAAALVKAVQGGLLERHQD